MLPSDLVGFYTFPGITSSTVSVLRAEGTGLWVTCLAWASHKARWPGRRWRRWTRWWPRWSTCSPTSCNGRRASSSWEQPKRRWRGCCPCPVLSYFTPQLLSGDLYGWWLATRSWPRFSELMLKAPKCSYDTHSIWMIINKRIIMQMGWTGLHQIASSRTKPFPV